VISIALYVLVSLMTCRERFNMDRMLHRGRYARTDEKPTLIDAPSSERGWRLILERLGFDREMTRSDRWVTGITLAWPIVFTGLFFMAIIAHAAGWSPGNSFWVNAWGGYTVLALIVALIVVIWFTIGGLKDLQAMFTRLGRYHTDDGDDGRVINHHNADE